MNDFKSYLSDTAILAISPDENQRNEILEGLQQAGCVTTLSAKTIKEAKTALANHDVGAVFIALPQVDARLLKEVTGFAAEAQCAVALFLQARANIRIGEIVDAGICTVVVDGLAANRIPDLLETTIYRYGKMRGMQIRLEQVISELEERKLIDRAKALLIEQRKITEPEAHKLLQRAAMNKNCKISDIAHTIIIASEI